MWKALPRLSVFWRTLSLLILLLAFAVMAWVMTALGISLDKQGGLSAQAQWLWLACVLVGTFIASAVVAMIINRPIKDLSFAATRIREGEFDSRLDENTLTSEIRQVNMGFNRMARELAKVEADRAVMLAGISHDLRTPLARLRLEAEMSVQDEEARQNMASDIDQLDAIIDKFMDYARPGDPQLTPVHLATVVEREVRAFRVTEHIHFAGKLPQDCVVMADDTELGRVFQNLFENARRYGRSPDKDVAEVMVDVTRAGSQVIITVRDRGAGVEKSKLPQLTTPFFRGDTARTAATGAGLGLAIVEKSLQRMGGDLRLGNAPEGGFMAQIALKAAPTKG